MPVQDRTEPATPRRREDAREEGRVAKSVDINSALVLLASLLAMRIGGPYVFSGLMDLTRETFMNLHSRGLSAEGLPMLVSWYGSRFMMLCAPVVLGTAAMALAANVLQVGFKVTPKALRPDLTRLDPIKGIARLASWRSLVELGKSTLKVAIIAYFVYTFLREQQPALIDLASMSPRGIGIKLGGMCWGLAMRGALAMLAIGVLDYIYQRFHFEQTLRMTKQEIKDEHKRAEGDPQVKGRIRQRQRDLARGRQIQEVARADVVITSPTHIAVALKYDTNKMSAPTVVAKGQRLIAEKIKAMAEAHQVPIVENPPIARLLYKVVEVGHQIPEDLYQAVAEILAYVFQMNQKAARAY
ncbi:MAG: flagellar biosynthesis protein FlhB [Armatimonadota bacterium]|nr:flagellar biosynthesis protein FlhB [Armatimonadota bacterium]